MTAADQANAAFAAYKAQEGNEREPRFLGGAFLMAGFLKSVGFVDEVNYPSAKADGLLPASASSWSSPQALTSERSDP